MQVMGVQLLAAVLDNVIRLSVVGLFAEWASWNGENNKMIIKTLKQFTHFYSKHSDFIQISMTDLT